MVTQQICVALLVPFFLRVCFARRKCQVNMSHCGNSPLLTFLFLESVSCLSLVLCLILFCFTSKLLNGKWIHRSVKKQNWHSAISDGNPDYNIWFSSRLSSELFPRLSLSSCVVIWGCHLALQLGLSCQLGLHSHLNCICIVIRHDPTLYIYWKLYLLKLHFFR
jgi:hypothetical protein